MAVKRSGAGAPLLADGRLAGWAWFMVWAIIGVAAMIGLVSFALWPIIVPVGLGGVALAASRSARRSAWGLVSGGGLALLVVAYIQRDGPGTTCWQTATEGGCEQHLDPRPWLVAGTFLVLLGIAFYAAARSTRGARHVRRTGAHQDRAGQ